MVASQDVPGHLEGWLSVHILKGLLEEEKKHNNSGFHYSQKREVTKLKKNFLNVPGSIFPVISSFWRTFVNTSVIPSLHIKKTNKHAFLLCLKETNSIKSNLLIVKNIRGI